MIPEFIETFLASLRRLPDRFAGVIKPARSQAANQRNSKRKKYGPFKDRRSRHQNITNLVDRWQRQASGGHALTSTKLPLPYRRTTGILTKGERAFWVPLFQAVKGKYRIFCKVRLADVVCCPSAGAEERRWFQKIGRYHVDFVICDPNTTCPILVIELDDRSHRSMGPKRLERDAWKDEVLRAANVPVYRVRAQEAYDPSELSRSIDVLIGSAAT